ncbi:hypothetical protein [Paraburkholderia aspalathi]|uniref:hypothetical protein n=1 Tax=Paraburkholderia aspalathi TaxID=1324617 RepID=UPI00190CE6F3|nr:hypothetical protein [Paraburkholderia aspalathi]MBK3844567.1 hypothetical protein [Paraburkholderia aspalathi]
MTLAQKSALPGIARGDLTPQEREVLAWVEALVTMANSQQQDIEQLEREVIQLRKAGKRA